MEQVRTQVICAHHLVRSGILGARHQRCLDKDSACFAPDDNIVSKSLYVDLMEDLNKKFPLSEPQIVGEQN